MITRIETAERGIAMLSILICHLPERVTELNTLIAQLEPQAKAFPNVEILINDAERGEPTGCKRNALIEEACGKYVVHVDDDDKVSHDYVEKMLWGCEKGTDCVGMCGEVVYQNKPNWQFRHSITVSNWCKDKKNRIYFRTPNHLNPILKEICVRIPFKPITIGEDHDFSDRIKPLLKTETFVEGPVYFYLIG